MIKTLLTYLLLVAATTAQASNTAVLAWQAPSTYSNGTPITTPLTFNVYQGLKGQTKTKGASVMSTEVTITSGLADGATYCWHVTAATAEQESAPSNEACKTFTPGIALPVFPVIR